MTSLRCPYLVDNIYPTSALGYVYWTYQVLLAAAVQQPDNAINNNTVPGTL